jgi:CBS domain-containing protein
VATIRASAHDVAELRAGRVPATLHEVARRVGVTIATGGGADTLYERIGDRDREWYLGEDESGRDAIVTLTEDHRLAVRIAPACRFEYWFYYLYDQGLNGHLHDSEHAFVFVQPLVRRGEHDLCRSTATGRITGVATTPPLVRAVVGAGHEAHTANNILVASPERPRETASAVMEARHNLVFPAGLPFHMPILVELGKHASAPDRSFDGRFDFGMDANVFPESGTGPSTTRRSRPRSTS